MAYVYADGIREDILRLVPPDGRIIGSVGCGTGATEAVLVQGGREVHGVDMAPEAIEVARNRLTSARLVSPDQRDYFAPASLDGLILADVLEHLPQAWLALEEFAKAVRPGGWVVISVPNARYLDCLWQLVVRGDWPEEEAGLFDSTHLQNMTHRRLKRWCSRAGLDIIQWSGASGRGWRENRWRRWLDRLTFRLFHELMVFQIQVLCRKTGAAGAPADAGTRRGDGA